MVMFHLTFIEEEFPYAKEMVYTFHMPVFLVISGYFLGRKGTANVRRRLVCVGLPYLIMESLYILMAARLQINENIEGLSLPVFLEKLFWNPLGPYWFLLTIIIVTLVCRVIEMLTVRLPRLLQTLLLGLSVGALSLTGSLALTPFYCFFVLAGILLGRSGREFEEFFHPSLLAFLPLAVMFSVPLNFSYYLVICASATYLMCSLLLAVFGLLPASVTRYTDFIGRNTLPILLFSPFFTFSARYLVPLFGFDPTHLLYLLVATGISVAGSLLLALVLDKAGLSVILFGKKTVLV